MPGFALVHAREKHSLYAGVTRHRFELTVFSNASVALPQWHLPPAKDDLVAQWWGRLFRDATAHDVQLVHPVQLFSQVTSHDLGQARLHATARDNQRTRRLYLLYNVRQHVLRSPTQVYQRLPGCYRGPNSKGNGGPGKGSNDGIKICHKLRGCRLVAQIERNGGQFLTAFHAPKFRPCSIQLLLVHVTEGHL